MAAGTDRPDRGGAQFASDNNAGMCPEALAALIEANGAGHALGYGGDPWTERACNAIRALLEAPEAEVFLVYNGTAANALSLAQLCRSYNAVIAHAFSHIEWDEAGAVGFFSGGASLITADTAGGKLTPGEIERLATKFGRGFHHVKPAAVSITQATEVGTVHTLAELRVLTETAHRLGLKVHLDGARFANAVASLGCSAADMSWRAGVDVLSLGGVKNGLGIGEAVVFFNPADAHEFEWRMKQAGQINSKMRLMAAPWVGLIETGAWRRHAEHANAMARRLGSGLAALSGFRLLHPVEANAVFADIPVATQERLRAKGWLFYTFLGATGCRLMCAWDTPAATVDAFLADAAAS
ncbi:MAG TPA: low specificity L-threonine aldolase [Hyphomicrobiaceae bacterium]|nr:low specificity L-threonine aldolase [Hyphomicrobiaceae bacterium]